MQQAEVIRKVEELRGVGMKGELPSADDILTSLQQEYAKQVGNLRAYEWTADVK